MDPVVEEPLHDNLLFLTSAGIDLSDGTGFSKLETNAGWATRMDVPGLTNSGWNFIKRTDDGNEGGIQMVRVVSTHSSVAMI